jgi:hypothetical protein
MPRTVPMIAVQPMTYQRRDLVPGEAFDCSLGYAIIAERRGRALPKDKAESRAADARGARRQYLRRDLVPER